MGDKLDSIKMKGRAIGCPRVGDAVLCVPQDEQAGAVPSCPHKSKGYGSVEELRYKLEDFEGPLDLMLALVAKHKMELCDIRIYELIDQYLAFIGEIGPEQLDPTSEFIEMAARLVYMKSVALLPRQEETAELERELTGQLVEYHLCKLAAGRLRDMSEGVTFFVREPMEMIFNSDYAITHQALELLEAYMSMMGRGIRMAPPDAETFDPFVAAPIVSVSSRIVAILRKLRRGTATRLSDLFGGVDSRSEAVATFLGVLELMKAHRLALDDEGNIVKSGK